MQHLPDVTEYGYEREANSNKVRPKLMATSISAPELLNELVCDCPGSACDDDACTCLINYQPCSEACKCGAMLSGEEEDNDNTPLCTNPFTARASAMNDEDSSESD